MNILDFPYVNYEEVRNEMIVRTFNAQLCEDGTVKYVSHTAKNPENHFICWQQHDNEIVLKNNHLNKIRFQLIHHSPQAVVLLSNNNGTTITLTCLPQRTDLFPAYTRNTNAKDIAKGYLIVGSHTYGKVKLVDQHYGNKLIISNFCSISEDTQFIMSSHSTHLITTYPFGTLNSIWSDEKVIENDHIHKGNIIVGNDVWIGKDVKIMSGVTIGDGAVIGAGSVVTKNVAPYSVVVGMPAQHLKYRVKDAQMRRQLQEIAWWSWPLEKIEQNLNKIMNRDVRAFIDEFYPQEKIPAKKPKLNLQVSVSSTK